MAEAGAAKPLFVGPDRKNVVEQLVDNITATLLDGRLKPGSVLPPERDFAASLGVNRTSLRQALARLEQIGLVKARQGVGTIVCDPAESTDASVLAMLVGRHGPDLVADALDVRQVLAPMVARLAAERARPEDADRLARAMENVETASGAAQSQLAEAAFFDAVIDATDSVALRFLWNSLNAVYRSTLELFEEAYDDHEHLRRALGEISAAILRADADAAAGAMARYSADNARRMLASFRSRA